MKDFILYEQSLELKELGFDEPCFGWFKGNEFTRSFDDLYPKEKGERFEIIKAPTYSQAFRWFREKFNMPSKIEATFEHETPNQYHYFYQIVTDDFIAGDGVMLNWTYEEAELACLKKLIEILKTNEIS